MNLIHLKFETMFGDVFTIAWFDENLKVYQIHWHGIDHDGIIGAKLDYSLDVLDYPRQQIEKLLLDSGIQSAPPA